MSVQKLCRETYKEFVDHHPTIPNEFKRFLRTHERVPQFIDNLAKEIQKLKTNVKRETVVAMVRDTSEMFIRAALQQAEERALSPIKRLQMKQKQDDAETFRRQAEQLEKKGADHVTEDGKGETTRTTTVID
jgi:GrpB-like predicted nucleotidyltransferase (UPF0157 family)